MSHKVLKPFRPLGSSPGTVVKTGADYDGADNDLWIQRGYLVEPEGWVDPSAPARPVLAAVDPVDDLELTAEQAAVVMGEYAEVKNKKELAAFVEKWELPVDTERKAAVVRADVEKVLEPLKALLPDETEGDGPEGNGAGEGDGDDETTGDEAPAGDSGS